MIENDVQRIRNAARFGFKVYYGDGTRLDVLRAAGAAHARVIAVCVDKAEEANRIVEMCKAEFPLAQIHARAYDRIHALELVRLGVDTFTRETFDAALAFGSEALAVLSGDEQGAAEIAADVRQRDMERLALQQAGGLYAPAITGEPAGAARTAHGAHAPHSGAQRGSARDRAIGKQGSGRARGCAAMNAPAPSERKHGIFTQGSIMRHVVVMTATGSIGLMAIFVVDFLTLLYISWLGDAQFTAAVGFAAQVSFFLISMNIGLSIAVSALMARDIGAGNRARGAAHLRLGHRAHRAAVGRRHVRRPALPARPSHAAGRQRPHARRRRHVPAHHHARQHPDGGRHGDVGRAALGGRCETVHVRDAVGRGGDRGARSAS